MVDPVCAIYGQMIYCRDVVEYLKTVDDASYDAVLCDPPYGLKFMGKRWDISVPDSESWAEMLRVLKPGAPMLAFGGTRTVHRLVCAIEEAGFEIRDQLVYLYGMGFPKSQRADLAIDKTLGVEHAVTGADGAVVPTKAAGSEAGQRFAGYGTALKPGHEPIVLARKPMIGTLGANLVEHGTGALNIDGARLGGDEDTSRKPVPNRGIIGYQKSIVTGGQGSPLGRWPANVILDEDAAQALDESVLEPGHKPVVLARKPMGTTLGANLIEHGTGALNIDGCRLVTGEKYYDPHKVKKAHSGVATGFSTSPLGGSPLGRWPANVILDEQAGAMLDAAAPAGPSRFFYCAKVSTREREDGCDRLPRRSAGEVTDREEDSAGLDSPRAGAGRTGGARNHHPTLKPISLTTYLARLLLPPPGGPVRRILVPYAGAGSEMIGAAMAGWDDVVGIERDPEYVAIAEARMRHWCEG